MDSSFSGHGSPASTNSNNSSPVPYYRADSLVVEKPSHFNHEASESIEFYSVMNGDNSRVEVLVIDQSQPSCNSAPQSPGSGYNSSKTTDDEDDNEGELDEGFCDELGDEGFAQLLVPDDHTPSESIMIPTSALLEDFDLGVDMFDSTEQAIPTSEPLKSPFNQLPMVPGSPYQLVATTSSCSSPVPIPQQDIQAQNDYNEYLNQAHSHSNMSSGSSYPQGYMADENDDLAMLLQVTGGLDVMTTTPEVLPLPIATCCEHTTGCSTIGIDLSPHSLYYATSTFTSQADPTFSTPTLTSVHMDQPNLMDLAEASELVLTGDGINTGLVNVGMSQLDSAPMITHSSSTTLVGSESSNFSTMSGMNMSMAINNVTNSVAGAQMCSRSSQTVSNSSRTTRSLSPAPSLAQSPSNYLHSRSPSPTPSVDQYSVSSVSSVSTGACYYTPSPDSNHLKLTGSPGKDRFRSGSPLTRKSSGKTSPVPASKDRLVDMPFYQFKKILDDPSIDTGDKEEAKNIRKRGKNKVAAKHCRQKKIEVVMGLQQEVDRMKEQKKMLNMKCQGLEHEIKMLKQKCSSFRSLALSSS